MVDIKESLNSATKRLASAGVPDGRKEAYSLIAFVTGRDQAFVRAHPEYELSPHEVDRMEACVSRRAKREPFQHIVGVREFCGLEFEVNSDVLVPRPETEQLVESAIAFLRRKSKSRFCEIGVGSGCISIALLKQIKTAVGTGIEISEKAIAVARRNAIRHSVDERLEIRYGDVFNTIEYSDRFDLIASNPPYIPAREIENLEPEVREFDPRIALTDGTDGLSIIRRIIQGAPRLLNSPGMLLLEIGKGQSDEVVGLFKPAIWKRVESSNDLRGIPRIVKAFI
jgi:release factor glutamine methyltransferase